MCEPPDPATDAPIPATDAPGLPMNRQNTSPRVASPPRAIAISGAARAAPLPLSSRASRGSRRSRRASLSVVACRYAFFATRRGVRRWTTISVIRCRHRRRRRTARPHRPPSHAPIGRHQRPPFRIARPSPSSTRMPGCVTTGASVRRGSDERGVEPEDESRRQRGPPRRYGGGPRARGGDRLPVCKSPHREKWSMASRFCRRRASLASSRAAVVGRSSSSRFDRSRSLRATSAVVVM